MGWLLAAIAIAAILPWLGRRWLVPRSPAGPLPDPDDAAVVHVDVGDELDLHAVSPHEVETAVQAFLEEAVRQGRRQVRIVHGKGIGVQRRRVHHLLQRHPDVESYADAPPPSHWGATLVTLRPRHDPHPGEAT